MNASAPKVFLYDKLMYAAELVAMLEAAGVEVTLGYPEVEAGRPVPKFTEDELIKAAAGHTALLGTSGGKITRRVIESLPEIRYISKMGIGYENIDVAAATDNGVMVTTTPVPSEISIVAEHAMMFLFALSKHLWYNTPQRMQAGFWRDDTRPMLTFDAMTVGIVGLGRIGSTVARHVQHFGGTVIANDILPKDVAGVEMVSLDELMARADAVTVHVSANDPSTYQLISADLIAKMKPTAFLINTSRGVVVDQQALTAALTEGRLQAAALDVFDGEPPSPSDPLFSLPNVIVTPHSAARGIVANHDMSTAAGQNVLDMVQGRVPMYLLNTEVLENR